MQEQIWRILQTMNLPSFFITAETGREGNAFPSGLENFVRKKFEQIQQGVSARRFVFQEDGWRIYITFFPTTEVVNEKYALKNKVVSRGYR